MHCDSFEEDWTTIVVAIVDETHTDRQTVRHTDIQCTLDWFISVQCRELHWTDRRQTDRPTNQQTQTNTSSAM